MPKLDSLKEDLKTLRFWLGVSVASFLAIISWLATNYSNADLWLIIVSIMLLFGFAVAVYIISKIMNKIIKEIKQTKKDE